MKTVFILMLFVSKSFLLEEPISAEQAANMLGQKVTVKAEIASTKVFEKNNRKTFFISLDKAYPVAPITVVLFDEAYRAAQLAENLQGKTIIVSGVVSEYNQRKQIVVDDVSKIQI